jgi:outer membrane protein OmpA-like peptidoglycan-associated protein
MKLRTVLLICVVLAFVACEGAHFGQREKGALAGGALGAGLGAIIGNQVGSTGAGIAIGGAMGALSGALVGNSMQQQDQDLQQREARISAQERELEENRRLIEELKRAGVDARVTSRGVVANLPDVLFDFDRSTLTSQAKGIVGDIAQVIEKNPKRHISVEGHTDSVGTLTYNKRLSEDRAQAVADELQGHGVSKRGMSIKGFGESQPIASNKTASGRARNRRVEVVIENQ